VRLMLMIAGVLGLSLLGWAVDNVPPTSTATVAPAPNANGWNNTGVTVTITASDNPGGSGVQKIYYKLEPDGGVVEVNGTLAQVQINQEGIYTLEFWAEDNNGNVETPHNSVEIKIDLTPPVVFVESPEEGAEYLLRQPVEAQWFAFDTLSGIETAEATTLSGEEILTEEPGFHVFVVRARDKAGNETVVEVNYQVVYKIIPAGAQGTFVDNPLPPEARTPKGKLPLLARYIQGQLIEIAFVLKDYFDEIYPDGVPTLTVTEVKFEGGRERHVIWSWLTIPYDPDEGVYRIYYPTAERKPGIYDLWLGFGDGTHVRIRVEVVPRAED